MYAGGSIQQGTPNPFQWNYSDRDLYKAMAVGGIVGGGIGAGGMYLANLAWGVGSTAMSLPSWGTISSALAYGNANMAQTVISSFTSQTPLELNAVFRSGITGMALGSFSAGNPVTFWELVAVNNIKENTDFIDGDALELHIGPFGYDFDKTEGGFYTMFDKGLTLNDRLDMGMESLYLLSFIPNDPLTSREIRSPFKTRVRQTNMGRPFSLVRYNKLNEYSTILDFRTYQGQETMESIRDWAYEFYIWYYHTFGKE